jgi:hypothetical protein
MDGKSHAHGGCLTPDFANNESGEWRKLGPIVAVSKADDRRYHQYSEGIDGFRLRCCRKLRLLALPVTGVTLPPYFLPTQLGEGAAVPGHGALIPNG